MIQIDLSKYIPRKFMALYDLNIPQTIIRENSLNDTFEDIEFLAPNTILTIPKKFFYLLLSDRIYGYPNNDHVKKSIKLTTTNKQIKENFNAALKDLLKERDSIDMTLHIKV